MKLTIKNICLFLWGFIFCSLLIVNTYVYLKKKNVSAGENIQNRNPVLQYQQEIPRDIKPVKVKNVQSKPIPPDPNIPISPPQKVGSSTRIVPKLPEKTISRPKSHDLIINQPQSWNSFLSIPYDPNSLHYANPLQMEQEKVIKSYKPNVCNARIAEKLAVPKLNDEEFKWCRWALSPTGANVIVGKSWGQLKSKADKEKFDALNCNSVQNGKNPSCDDSWGDAHIKNWLKSPATNFKCADGKPSQVNCYRNDNTDLYCELFNAQIDFNKVKKVSRGQSTPSKLFQQDFLSTDCNPTVKSYPEFPFPHLYSPKLSSDQCDIVYNGTVLMYSHDDIRNLGHTLNDIMNVWIMLWISKFGRYSHNLEMLNIDSFKLGHNFDDEPNAFFLHYQKSLKYILKGKDFQNKVVCFKHILLQPIPPRFFIWESWFVDLPCSFIGPSSLYQRWNLNVRASYGLLDKPSSRFENNEKKKLKILVIVRNEHSNMWGTQRTSRNFLNLLQLTEGLKKYETDHPEENIEVLITELNKYTFEEQITLLSDVSIMIGAHGAGIASSMHLPIGSKYCCGVIEIYPQGEFFPIKGHGNMARKMGVHYDRLDLTTGHSRSDGCEVPVDQLIEKMKTMVAKVREEPTCIHPDVVNNPYLEL
jgi:hypothetical protein